MSLELATEKEKPLLWRMLSRWAAAALIAYLLINAALFLGQRRLLYFPSHHAFSGGLAPWYEGAELVGAARERPSPPAVWLVFHGNGGQADDREYVLPHLPSSDSVFFVEYPGYGVRPGSPSRPSFDAAAVQAYQALRRRFPGVPLNVFAESIGSGPACILAGEAQPPDRFVLVVPFDRMNSVAAGHFPGMFAPWLIRDRWDNGAALARYRGPVLIYGAAEDRVIPVRHARALAGAVPGSQFVLLPAGHNDWAATSLVRP